MVQSLVIAQRAACIFVAEEASFVQDGYDVVDQVLQVLGQRGWLKGEAVSATSLHPCERRRATSRCVPRRTGRSLRRTRTAGQDPAPTYLGAAAHFKACPGCRSDHDGLLEAIRYLQGNDSI